MTLLLLLIDVGKTKQQYQIVRPEKNHDGNFLRIDYIILKVSSRIRVTWWLSSLFSCSSSLSLLPLLFLPQVFLYLLFEVAPSSPPLASRNIR